MIPSELDYPLPVVILSTPHVTRCVNAASDSFFSTTLSRILLLATLLLAELLAASFWLDTGTLGSGFLSHALRAWGTLTVKTIVAFAVFFLVFGGSQVKAAIGGLPWTRSPVALRPLLGHLGVMTIFAALSIAVFGHHTTADLLVGVWIACGMLGIGLAALAFLPGTVWVRLIRSTGWAWVYALGAALLASLLGAPARSFWTWGSALTFETVSTILKPLIPNLVSNTAALTIGSPKFEVTIAPECSGFEGMGLMLAFGMSWLWFFRREYRFPRALVLIPAGIGGIWFLNTLRIAALILLGINGAAGVAAGGFHSQAGWISFIAAALAFSWGSRHLKWMRTAPPQRLKQHGFINPTALYVVPFLTILAASFVSRASTSRFEWLYPLRFVAAAAALWFGRREYRRLKWSIDGWAPAVGALAFLVWIALDRVLPTRSASLLAVDLRSLPHAAELVWLCFRVTATVLTVPIAEELAFRAFLIRRLIVPDFEAVSCQTFSLVPFLISSLAFGVLHGDRWLAGSIAGMLYALIFLRRGSIGEAITAHAVTNALLAVWVLSTGHWELW